MRTIGMDDFMHTSIYQICSGSSVTRNQMGPDANVYMGVHTWYHWYESLLTTSRLSFPRRAEQAPAAPRRCSLALRFARSTTVRVDAA